MRVVDLFASPLPCYLVVDMYTCATSAAASVGVPMEAKQYARHLVEQCMMQFFVAVKARETGQLFLKVCI